MSDKPIFALERLTKAYQGKKPVLQNVSLVFLENAKIGVIGQNGAGKSTMLRIMAGVDKEFDGVARLAEGKTVGYVPQEPKLAEGLTVRENVELAVAPVRALLKKHEDLSMKLGEDLPPKEMDKVMADLERLQHEIEAKDAWELDRHVETAMTKLHLPAGDKNVSACSGGERRRVALCRTLLEPRTCCCSTSRPTTSTSRPFAGSRRRCATTRALSSASRTIASSSTTSSAGCSKSGTAARSRTRATTPST